MFAGAAFQVSGFTVVDRAIEHRFAEQRSDYTGRVEKTNGSCTVLIFIQLNHAAEVEEAGETGWKIVDELVEGAGVRQRSEQLVRIQDINSVAPPYRIGELV